MADERTLRRYAEDAEAFAAQYNAVRPAFISRFSAALPNRGRLLDIGAGSGRDLAAFFEEGFDVYGIEPVAPLREAAVRQFPQLSGRIHDGTLPSGVPKDIGTFDAVHCSAVLMHLSREELIHSIITIRDLLNPGGVAHFSYCPERPGVDADHRAADGRLFNPIRTDPFKAILRRAGFAIISETESGDALKREDIRWVSLMVRWEGDSQKTA